MLNSESSYYRLLLAQTGKPFSRSKSGYHVEQINVNLNLIREGLEITLPKYKEGRVMVSVEGIVFKDLIPKRPFPFSYPWMVLFYDCKGKEVFGVYDYSKLDECSRKALEKAINYYENRISISRIIDVQSYRHEVIMKVETAKGMRGIRVMAHPTRKTADGKLILFDSRNPIAYEIDLNKADDDTLFLVSPLIPSVDLGLLVFGFERKVARLIE